jgi:hypothetical protein
MINSIKSCRWERLRGLRKYEFVAHEGTELTAGVKYIFAFVKTYLMR